MKLKNTIQKKRAIILIIILLFFTALGFHFIPCLRILDNKLTGAAYSYVKLIFFKCAHVNTFLFFTVFVPLFFSILGEAKRRYCNKTEILTVSSDLERRVYYICMAAFLTLQIYGVYNYQFRMQGDANTDILAYSSPGEKTVPANYRVAYLLNVFLIFPALHFQLPLKAVAEIYCINDAVFYLTVSLLIIFFTRRYDYASTVLATPVLLLGINFFFLGNALFISGPLIILFVAVHQTVKEQAIRISLLFPCLFFVIWSSPISLFLLVVFLPILYESLGDLYRDKWILLFMVLNITSRLLVMDAYDHGKIGDLHYGLDFNYLKAITKEFFTRFWFLAIITPAAIYFARKHNYLHEYRGLFVLPVLVGCCVANKAQFVDVNFTKFLYAGNLLLLTNGIRYSVKFYKNRGKAVITLLSMALLFGLSDVFNYGKFFSKRALLIKKLNEYCYRVDPQQSKWYISKDLFADVDGYGSYTESITFSAYQELPVAIQVVRCEKGVKKMLDSLPENKLFVFDGEGGQPNIEELNSHYFHFKKGAYKEITLNATDIYSLANP